MSSRAELREALERLKIARGRMSAVRAEIEVEWPRDLSAPDAANNAWVLAGEALRESSPAVSVLTAALATPDTGECGTCGGRGLVPVTRRGAVWYNPCPDCTGEAPEGGEAVLALERLYRAAIGSPAYTSSAWAEDATRDHYLLRRALASGGSATEGERDTFEQATCEAHDIGWANGSAHQAKRSHDPAAIFRSRKAALITARTTLELGAEAAREVRDAHGHGTVSPEAATDAVRSVAAREALEELKDAGDCWAYATSIGSRDHCRCGPCASYRTLLAILSASDEPPPATEGERGPSESGTDTASDSDTGAGDAPTDQPAESVGTLTVDNHVTGDLMIAWVNDGGDCIEIDSGELPPGTYDLIPRTPKEGV